VPRRNSRAAKFAALAIAGVGLAHFDGGIETALGIGFSARQTRPLAVVGTIGYLAYLAGNVARNR
jgi:predicted transporter